MANVDLTSELARKIVSKTQELLGITWDYDLSDVTLIEINKDYYDIYINGRISASTSIKSVNPN